MKGHILFQGEIIMKLQKYIDKIGWKNHRANFNQTLYHVQMCLLIFRFLMWVLWSMDLLFNLMLDFMSKINDTYSLYQDAKSYH